VTVVTKISAVFAIALLACGCGEKEPAPAPTPPAPPPAPVAPPKNGPAKVTMAPPLTDIQRTELNKSFTAARELAKQADKAKAEADLIEKTQGRAAANDKLVEAKDLYHRAAESVSDWLDGDLAGKVTDAQLKDYLGAYVAEVGKWQKAYADLSKVHKD
jgi:hypothetical protein